MQWEISLLLMDILKGSYNSEHNLHNNLHTYTHSEWMNACMTAD